MVTTIGLARVNTWTVSLTMIYKKRDQIRKEKTESGAQPTLDPCQIDIELSPDKIHIF